MSELESYKLMFSNACLVLAQIDEELGLPDDGCSSPERTLAAIKNLNKEIDELKPL